MAIEGPVRCTFCGADKQHTTQLVVGFGTVICRNCVILCHAAERGLPESVRVVPLQPPTVGPKVLAKGILPARHPFSVACPFCDREPTEGRRLFLGDGASICSECIALCDEMDQQESRTQ